MDCIYHCEKRADAVRESHLRAGAHVGGGELEGGCGHDNPPRVECLLRPLRPQVRLLQRRPLRRRRRLQLCAQAFVRSTSKRRSNGR
eukprot:4627541-Pyramimonas_sp.AAC.1